MGRAEGSPANAAEPLVEAAGPGSRVGEYGGIGVDGLAGEPGADLGGASYAHFTSKAAAFGAALAAGL
jgi:hypothetical protein